MNFKKRLKPIYFTLLACGLFLLACFENCSDPKTYSAASSAVAASSVQTGGGEGYGGKVYLSADVCGNGLAQSEIDVMKNGNAYLTRTACANLTVAKPVSVTYNSPDQGSLTYMGAIYKLTTSDSLQQQNSISFNASEMAVRPSNGLMSSDFPGFYVLLNNFALLTPIAVSTSKTFTISIDAIADVSNGVGAEMEIFVDGQKVGATMVMNETASATFVFKTPLTAGVHELSISFTNDVYTDALHDINLMLSTIRIQ